jgi:hypothetical protein
VISTPSSARMRAAYEVASSAVDILLIYVFSVNIWGSKSRMKGLVFQAVCKIFGVLQLL